MSTPMSRRSRLAGTAAAGLVGAVADHTSRALGPRAVPRGDGPRSSTNAYLAGNSAPLPAEVSALRLPVVGEVPEALRGGTLLRIGPNPLLVDETVGLPLVQRRRHGPPLHVRQRRWRSVSITAAGGAPTTPPRCLARIGADPRRADMIGQPGEHQTLDPATCDGPCMPSQGSQATTPLIPHRNVLVDRAAPRILTTC
jgi:hypothetical protein